MKQNKANTGGTNHTYYTNEYMDDYVSTYTISDYKQKRIERADGKHVPNKKESKLLRRLMATHNLTEEQVRSHKVYRQQLSDVQNPKEYLHSRNDITYALFTLKTLCNKHKQQYWGEDVKAEYKQWSTQRNKRKICRNHLPTDTQALIDLKTKLKKQKAKSLGNSFGKRYIR